MSENMNNETSSKRSDAIAEEAAEHLVALQTPDAKVKIDFVDWLKVSPEHVNEFLAVAALWNSLNKTSTQPALKELIQLAASDQNVVTLGQLAREPSDGANVPNSRAAGQPAQLRGARLAGWYSRWLGIAAAATLAAVLVGGVAPQLLPLLDPNLYRTAVGEQTSISLADGSVVMLNTQSTVRVDYSEGFRVIHLTEGEALFEVAKDSSRPFRVISGSAMIQAVGTQFNVRSVGEDVTVTVVEGIVDVSARRSRSPSAQITQLPDAGDSAPAAEAIEPFRLTVGQQARVESSSGQVAVIEIPAVENALAWRHRRLVFEHLSLKDVIDEFNRYNDPPIVVDDPELKNLPISGVFRANDRESFVQFLLRMKLAESQTRGDGTIVLRQMSGER